MSLLVYEEDKIFYCKDCKVFNEQERCFKCLNKIKGKPFTLLKRKSRNR